MTSKFQLKAFAPPKICVPLMVSKTKKLIELCERLVFYTPDCVEWRLDYMTDLSDETLNHSLIEMKRILPVGTAILATYRTKQEGGEGEALPKEYQKLCERLITSGGIHLIDIEFSQGDDCVAHLIDLAKEYNVISVLSYHNFSKTPDTETLDYLLSRMIAKDSDVVKIATMGEKATDYPRFYEVIKKWAEEYKSVLFIALVMGVLGQLSRLEGEKFGSVMTFARLGDGSAPGQYTIEEVRNYLDNSSRDLN